MSEVRFTISGRPVRWARMKRNGNQYYQAPEQVNAKRVIGYACKKAMKEKGVVTAPKGHAIALNVHAVYKLPDRMPKGDTRKIGDPHVSKPDADNLLKLVKDALSSVAYEDDEQVFSATVWKQWSDYNATKITLEFMGKSRMRKARSM